MGNKKGDYISLRKFMPHPAAAMLFRVLLVNGEHILEFVTLTSIRANSELMRGTAGYPRRLLERRPATASEIVEYDEMKKLRRSVPGHFKVPLAECRS